MGVTPWDVLRRESLTPAHEANPEYNINSYGVVVTLIIKSAARASPTEVNLTHLNTKGWESFGDKLPCFDDVECVLKYMGADLNGLRAESVDIF